MLVKGLLDFFHYRTLKQILFQPLFGNSSDCNTSANDHFNATTILMAVSSERIRSGGTFLTDTIYINKEFP